MKIIRQKKHEKKEFRISREMIAKFGEMIYALEDVKEVIIGVKFDDGSSISFKRDEDDDTLENFVDEMERD